MSVEAKRVYMCSVCESVHDNEYQAEECCPPEVWELWQCPFCEETHDTEEEALECCGADDEEEDLSTGQYRNYPAPSFFVDRGDKLSKKIKDYQYIEQFIALNNYVKD